MASVCGTHFFGRKGVIIQRTGDGSHHHNRKGTMMNRLRSILASGLVALMMVGVVYSDVTPGGGNMTGSYIGTWIGGTCVNTDQYQCVHLRFDIGFDFRLPF